MQEGGIKYMAESLYAKYVTSLAKFGNRNEIWGKGDSASLAPYRLDRPIDGANTSISVIWVAKDCACGVVDRHSPHKHDDDEMFIFLGTNPEDVNDLGAEVEFWLGEGEQTEKIAINTPSFVFVPKGLMHMPLYFRNVRRPCIRVMMGSKSINTFWYPVRE
jgi:hypothetical protein